jgi:hypothetical protein
VAAAAAAAVVAAVVAAAAVVVKLYRPCPPRYVWRSHRRGRRIPKIALP